MTLGFTWNSAPLWERGQDAFLVIRGLRVQSQPAAIVWKPRFATVLNIFGMYGCKNIGMYGSKNNGMYDSKKSTHLNRFPVLW